MTMNKMSSFICVFCNNGLELWASLASPQFGADLPSKVNLKYCLIGNNGEEVCVVAENLSNLTSVYVGGDNIYTEDMTVVMIR